MFKTLSILFVSLFVLVGAVAGQAIPLGPNGNLPFTTLQVGPTATGTIPAYQFVGLLTATPAAAATFTSDTAANFCALFPFVANRYARNYNWDFWLKDLSSTSGHTLQVAAGSGMTLVGTGAVAISSVTHFKMVLTSCRPGSEAGQIVSLETSTF